MHKLHRHGPDFSLAIDIAVSTDLEGACFSEVKSTVSKLRAKKALGLDGLNMLFLQKF